MLKEIITNIVWALGLIAGVPFFFIWLLSRLNRNTKQHIANRFGINSQLYFGFLGIMIHELSHLIVAMIFGHRITGFRLISLPTNSNPTLGYVNHRWNQANFYQNIGNLFIGIAPIFGCCLATLALAKCLIPNSYTWLLEFTQLPLSVDLQLSPDFHWQGLLLFIILAANICIGGFDLSPADFQNARQGFWQAIITIIILSLLISFTPWQATLFTELRHLTIIITAISIFNLILSGTFNLIFRSLSS